MVEEFQVKRARRTEKPCDWIDLDTSIKEHLSHPASPAETKYLSSGDVHRPEKNYKEEVLSRYATICVNYCVA